MRNEGVCVGRRQDESNWQSAGKSMNGRDGRAFSVPHHAIIGWMLISILTGKKMEMKSW